MKYSSNQRFHSVEHHKHIESLASGIKFKQKLFLVEGLSFEQLYCRAETIRHQFIQQGGQPSIPLCLCSDNRAHTAAALIASLQSSGPALLIPYAYDAKTLQEAHKSIPFTHALVEKDHHLPSDVTAIPLPETDDRHHRKAIRPLIQWDSPWIYLFTGGSTGNPRIWSKTPRNLLLETAYLAETFAITDHDTILATVPVNHIYGLLYSVLLPLLSGARVSIATPSFPNEIIQHLQKIEATILVSIPAHYRALKTHPITDHHVRKAFSSAGALAEKDCLDFHNTTGMAITEIYGSTETGGIAQRSRAQGQKAFTPFECVDVRIDHEHLRVRSHFLSNKLKKSDDGFFKTADRAAWTNPSGFMLMGRSDGIIKVGGKRVDLAKTREILMKINGVRDAYVFTIPVSSGRENQIVALVEGHCELEQIIHHIIQKNLPPYARPRHIKVTQQIPLSSTGKYNRNAIEKHFEL